MYVNYSKPVASLINIFNKTRVFDNRPFVIIDIGCSGGIDESWKYFGNNLHAYGVDPVVSEIKRLKTNETSKNIKYIPGYIGLPADHPVIVNRKDKTPWGYNPTYRLSSYWAAKLSEHADDDDIKKMNHNRWSETELSKPELRCGLSEFASQHNINSVDFIKIDVDGDDYYVLLSAGEIINTHEVLGMLVEVNYYGTDCDTDNTFHNTDRLMRKYGFDLCDLTVRRYSRKVLPSRFLINMPAQTEFGVPYQGDALYIKDIIRAKNEKRYRELSIDKLCKLVVIYTRYGLPDCAVEILLEFRDEFTAHDINVDLILDLLTPAHKNKTYSYKEYMSLFENNIKQFMPGIKERITRKLINKFLKLIT